MAKNYIIFNNADESLTDSNYPTWGDSWVGLTNQPTAILSGLTGIYAGNSFVADGITPFQFPVTATTGNSKWIMITYDYVDASTTGSAHIISIVNALKTYVNTTQSAASLDAEYSNIISQSMSVFFSSTLGISNVSSGTFSSATYNWGAVDTSGYTYSDGFASSFSGNEDYATDYWAKASSVQTDRVGSKTQVISKIATNSDDILEFIVKNALTQNQIHDLYIQLVRDEIITQ